MIPPAGSSSGPSFLRALAVSRRLAPLVLCLSILPGCSSNLSRWSPGDPGVPPGLVLEERTPEVGAFASLEGPPDALALLAAAIEAQGGDLVAEVEDVSVSYRGEWGRAIRRIQKGLVDHEFRKASQERLLLPSGLLVQVHEGPGGTKTVYRSRDEVRVFYNGERDTDPTRESYAALVADAYRLFLLGPSYFRWAAGEVRWDTPVTESGRTYDRLHFRLKPGLGLSQQDYARLWLDRETRRHYRVELTLEGTESTQGAVVDVTFSDFREIDGYWWPTYFLERVRSPLKIFAHEWHLTGLDLGRGYTAKDLEGPVLKGSAAAPPVAPW